ncbi:unnamed protein product [Gongylonema pulchrum]|uniref:HTTM domain-containing protein n=1 Tax=Gongylonema pulchrum TaxID=637853 RepID=A0A183DNU0_9BILA|nr:unnamed protein product [Gongylonema pulchrum]
MMCLVSQIALFPPIQDPATFPENCSVFQEFKLPIVAAKWAWLLQELPSFIIPLCYFGASFTNLHIIRAMTLSFFILHYFNRLPFLVELLVNGIAFGTIHTECCY